MHSRLSHLARGDRIHDLLKWRVNQDQAGYSAPPYSVNRISSWRENCSVAHLDRYIPVGISPRFT